MTVFSSFSVTLVVRRWWQCWLSFTTSTAHSYRWTSSSCTPEPSSSAASSPSSPSVSPLLISHLSHHPFHQVATCSPHLPIHFPHPLLWRTVAVPWTLHAHWLCWWASSLPLFSISPLEALKVLCLSWCTPQSQSLTTLDLTMCIQTSVTWEYLLPHLATLALDHLPQEYH